MLGQIIEKTKLFKDFSFEEKRLYIDIVLNSNNYDECEDKMIGTDDDFHFNFVNRVKSLDICDDDEAFKCYQENIIDNIEKGFWAI